jgi:hypothetical protein
MKFDQEIFFQKIVLITIGVITPMSFAQTIGTHVFDGQGVQQLLPSKPNGVDLSLGSDDPNTSINFSFDFKAKAIAMQDGGLKYWRLLASPLHYSSGGEGFSTRLHLETSHEKQTFTWKTQQGYLASPADIHNQEFTVYVRVQELASPKTAQISMKIRGGGHHANDPDAASCVMMTFAPSIKKVITRFGKELTHPIYDYVNLVNRISTGLVDGRWVGLKLLSWKDPRYADQVTNQLFIDTEGLNEEGKPANQWKMISEYVDVEGKSTGNYTKMVDWSGRQTTLRVDGYRLVDFAYPSLREIAIP